jgi:hypothetical protein
MGSTQHGTHVMKRLLSQILENLKKECHNYSLMVTDGIASFTTWVTDITNTYSDIFFTMVDKKYCDHLNSSTLDVEAACSSKTSTRLYRVTSQNTAFFIDTIWEPFVSLQVYICHPEERKHR